MILLYRNSFTIRKDIVVSMLLMFSLALLLEKVYMPSHYVTGQFNSIITPILLLILIGLALITNISIKKNSFYFVLICLLLLSFNQLFNTGEIKEFLRYFLSIIIAYIAGQINFKKDHLNFLFRGILVLSIVFSLYHYNDILLQERLSGFLLSSPTLFSFVILVSITYLMNNNFENKLDSFLVIIGIIIIWFTQSRSTLLVALLYWVITLINIYTNKNKYLKLIKLISLVIILLYSLYFVSEVINGNQLSRENGNSSTQTRISFMLEVVNIIKSDSTTLLIGNGPGESYKLISERVGRNTPAHFDILTVLLDFGIFGTIMMLVLPIFVFKNWSWQGWVLLLIGSIHNLIYFPIGVFLAILCGRALGKRN